MRPGLVLSRVLMGALVGVVGATASSALGNATIGDTAAIAACEAAIPALEYGEVSGLARAESTTTQAVADWQEQRYEPDVSGLVSPLRGVPLGPAIVCLYRGQFVTPTAPMADGSRAAPHNVLRVLVVGRQILLDSAGYEGRMDPETPGLWDRPE